MIKKTKAGTYEVCLRTNKRTKGAKDVRLKKTFEKQKDALDWEASQRIQVRSGAGVAAGAALAYTVAQVAKLWLERKDGSCRLQTYNYYERHVRLYITPLLGDRRMTELAFTDVDRAGARWSKERGISEKNRNKIYTTLGDVFVFARKFGIKNDPMADVDRTMKHEKPEVMEREAQLAAGEIPDHSEEVAELNVLRSIGVGEVYSALELKRLIDASNPGLDRVKHLTAIYTGMRHGELNGLQWAAVDLKKGTIFVRRSLTEKKGGPILERVKTKNAYRYLDLAAEVLHELKLWRLKCPNNPNDLVFCDEFGRPLNRKGSNTSLAETAERAGIVVLSMNNLRHSYATQLLEAGISDLEVSRRMGHADSTTTRKIYARWCDRERSSYADILERRIQDAGKEALVNGGSTT